MCWCVATASDSASESATSCAVQVQLIAKTQTSCAHGGYPYPKWIYKSYKRNVYIYIYTYYTFFSIAKEWSTHIPDSKCFTQLQPWWENMDTQHFYPYQIVRVWHVHDNEDTPWEPCLAILSFANFDLLQRSFTWGKREKKNTWRCLDVLHWK